MNHSFLLKKFFCFLSIVFIISSFTSFVDHKVPAGIWRAEILRADGQTIVFQFQITYKSGQLLIDVMNGAERLRVDQIQRVHDSLLIDMPFFDSHFAFRILGNQNLSGVWIKNYGDRQVVLPCMAIYNELSRFNVADSPRFDITGRWAVVFRGLHDSTESVGEFVQTGSKVSGTFLTTTGDYRYLEGVVDGDTLKLSTFDGGHAYSFKSKISDQHSMSGFYYSGPTSVETWTAVKNDHAKLPDEYSLTHLKNQDNAKLQFRFPDLKGDNVSLSDPVFKNKVVIVQILGSWCPNCMDETKYLSEWYNENRPRGVEIVGLAYERTTSLADAKRLLHPFIERFHVTYPILFTGVTVSDSLRTEKTVPEIDRIMGFPTTIFIDKKGNVRKISTGFNGPGTGEYYKIYKKEFNKLVNSLLAE